ncbi:hypothetical protein TRICI_003749 [Trichomonascus ciferrii]|uniref:Uncharacterized protein n=1 Tax=Trichomonascus ciferrii TaxID=44093 RepID=A0A642V2V3_9ASCO|nr:hypothetical protein TRICI_003749 [Trichomonascus ciferrii]
MERRERAQERAKEEERLAKLEERRKMREERKELVEKDLKRFQDAMNEISEVRGDLVNNDDDESGTDTGDDVKGDNDNQETSSDYSDWEGIDDETPKKGVLKKQQYDDDTNSEGVTTVTVEEFNMNEDSDSEKKIRAANVDLSKSDKVLKSSLEKAELSAMHLAMQKKCAKAMMTKKLSRKRNGGPKQTRKKSRK